MNEREQKKQSRHQLDGETTTFEICGSANVNNHHILTITYLIKYTYMIFSPYERNTQNSNMCSLVNWF